MRWDFWRVWGRQLRCCYYCDIPRQSHGSEWWTWCGSNTRPSHYESDADYLAELQVLVEGLLPTNMVPMGIEPMAVCLIIARI